MQHNSFFFFSLKMGSYFFKILFAMLLCIFHYQVSIHGFNSPTHVKCIESERQALLNFNQGLIDDFGMLSTWSDDDNNTDCCDWKGIQCNNQTGHVQKLNLSGQYLRLKGTMNLTSLIALQNIQYLDMSNNYFGESQIPELIGSFTNLRYLNLSLAKFDGSIPYQLGNLSRLRYLDLGWNYLNGTIPYQLGNLSQLRYLDLYMNDLNGEIPSQLGKLTSLRCLRLGDNDGLKITDAKWLTSLSLLTTLDLRVMPNLSRECIQMISEIIPNLRELRLTYCQLSDHNISSIFHSQSNLSFLDLSGNMLTSSTLNLQILDLGNNNLEGGIPAFLGNICTLQELYLDDNNLSGEISSFIDNFSRCNRHVFQTSLRILYVPNNHFTGEIPKSIGLLDELEVLHLQENHLKGDINELHFTNLSKLERLDLTDNSLSLEFATTWVPPFQLSSLGLASCKLGPSFPSWLQTQSHLDFLDISDAGIDDFVPEWFWNKLQSITLLNMSYNGLKGTIPNLSIKIADSYIILNSNQLEGEIPVFLSKAHTLDLSKNKISDFEAFLCKKGATPNTYTLDLSNNQLTGHLPDCWENQNSLAFLDLSNNKLSGKIPQSMGTLVNLEALVLRNNSLIGELPFRLKNCADLVILDVGENLLSGSIPSWIGENLQQLKILSLRINHFIGSVPAHLCYLNQIHILDLSRNNLSGGIPTCLNNFTEMRVISYYKMLRVRKITSERYYFHIYVSNVLFMWKGQDYEFLNPEFLLNSIDLSSNGLTGELPKEIGYLLGLVSLNLSRNNLNGGIPSGIGNLNSLEFLDLSGNYFSGMIPSTLSKIDRLTVLNLSNNNLIGRIPWGRQLQTFDASSFEGNPGLCGQQLNKTCPGDETTAQPQGQAVHGEDDDSVFYEGLYMSLGLGFFIGFWGLLGPILLWQPWRIAYLRFLNRLTDYVQL